MTIDQLAHEAGIPTSTVRLYQNRGLLLPSLRQGRMGFYNAEHRDWLRLIARLQERGFQEGGQNRLHCPSADDIIPGQRATGTSTRSFAPPS